MSSSAGVAIRLIGSARVAPQQIELLAADLSAAVDEEPGTVGYRWNQVPDSERWTIDEEYTDEAALAEHIRHLAESGLLRRLGKAFRIEQLVVLSGDAESVGRRMGLTPSPSEG